MCVVPGVVGQERRDAQNVFITSIWKTIAFKDLSDKKQIFSTILGFFKKLRSGTISFVMSVCVSVCTSVNLCVRMEQFGFHWTDLHEILYMNIWENLSRKFKFH